MGFALQDRGALFNLDPQSPDSLAGRKRPFHTIIPGFIERGDQHIGFGIMGGMNQPLAHAQFVSNLVDYHMNIQEALSTARFTVSHVPAHLGCNIVIESRVPADVRDQLTRMGHIFDVRGAYSTAMGRGQAVLDDSSTHVHYGAPIPAPTAPPSPSLRPYHSLLAIRFPRTELFVPQRLRGQNAGRGVRRIERGQQRNPDGNDSHQKAVGNARSKRQRVDGVNLGRQVNEVIMAARP